MQFFSMASTSSYYEQGTIIKKFQTREFRLALRNSIVFTQKGLVINADVVFVHRLTVAFKNVLATIFPLSKIHQGIKVKTLGAA